MRWINSAEETRLKRAQRGYILASDANFSQGGNEHKQFFSDMEAYTGLVLLACLLSNSGDQKRGAKREAWQLTGALQMEALVQPQLRKIGRSENLRLASIKRLFLFVACRLKPS